jgi:signal transduction histidine kinase
VRQTVPMATSDRRWWSQSSAGASYLRGLKSSYLFYSVLSFVALILSSYGYYDRHDTFVVRCALSGLAAGLFYLAKYRPVASLFGLAGYSVAIGWFAPSFSSVEILLVVSIFLVSWKTSFSLVATMAIGVGSIFMMYTGKTQEDMFSRMLSAVLISGLGVGFGSQTRRLRIANEQLVSLAEVDRRNAVVEERRRIARDLHDVAAHLLTAIIVKSKLALRLDTKEELQPATQFAVTSASDALNSIRTLVGVLSDDAEVAPLTPQPRVAELHEVAQRMEAAGLSVNLHIDELPSLSRQVELAAVRIVQEGLTNVLRHRGPGKVWVRIARVADDLRVSIDDDGAINGARSEFVDPARRPAGRGLLGMRERAVSCGGSLTIEPSHHGGWRVVADLPGGGE